MRRIVMLAVSIGVLTLVAGVASANTVASSTMYFQSQGAYTLTDNGDGTYTGVIPMKVNAGYDIYAKNGATAWFGDDPGSGQVWTPVTISNHDAWPTWTPDTPDWYQYSLNLYVDSGVQKWAVRNHSGTTAAKPWYTTGTAAHGVPMSGTMDWTNMIATETDVGAYLPGTGTAEIPGGAASKGAGAGYWDMDWSWGSEAVPLQVPAFYMQITSLGGTDYEVTMSPIPEPISMIFFGTGIVGVFGFVARRKMRKT